MRVFLIRDVPKVNASLKSYVLRGYMFSDGDVPKARPSLKSWVGILYKHECRVGILSESKYRVGILSSVEWGLSLGPSVERGFSLSRSVEWGFSLDLSVEREFSLNPKCRVGILFESECQCQVGFSLGLNGGSLGFRSRVGVLSDLSPELGSPSYITTNLNKNIISPRGCPSW